MGQKPVREGVQCTSHSDRDKSARIGALLHHATLILRESDLIFIFNYCQWFLFLEQIIKQKKKSQEVVMYIDPIKIVKGILVN